MFKTKQEIKISFIEEGVAVEAKCVSKNMLLRGVLALINTLTKEDPEADTSSLAISLLANREKELQARAKKAEAFEKELGKVLKGIKVKKQSKKKAK